MRLLVGCAQFGLRFRLTTILSGLLLVPHLRPLEIVLLATLGLAILRASALVLHLRQRVTSVAVASNDRRPS